MIIVTVVSTRVMGDIMVMKDLIIHSIVMLGSVQMCEEEVSSQCMPSMSFTCVCAPELMDCRT